MIALIYCACLTGTQATKLEIASLFVDVPEIVEAARNGSFDLLDADPKSDQGVDNPYEAEEEWAVYLDNRDQNATLIMKFPDMPQKMKITVDDKKSSLKLSSA